MSIGTFADRATRNHIKQTTKQKKIVFGERPLTISAQSLKVNSSMGTTQDGLNTSQSIAASSTSNLGQTGEQVAPGAGQNSKAVSPW